MQVTKREAGNRWRNGNLEITEDILGKREKCCDLIELNIKSGRLIERRGSRAWQSQACSLLC